MLRKEDYSDSFFQSKHINKRREILAIREKETAIKLKNGLEKIKEIYKSDIHVDDREKQFLNFFSKLSLDTNVLVTDYCHGYFMFDKSKKLACFFDYSDVSLDMSREILSSSLADFFDMSCKEAKMFISFMMKKYFKINDVTIRVSSIG